MVSNDVLSDLADRLDRGIRELQSLEDDAAGDPVRCSHLASKRQGLELVKDWLRGYGPVSDVEQDSGV